MSIRDRGKTPGSDMPTERRAESRHANGLLTKRMPIVVAAGAAVIALLLMVWQAAQILSLIFAGILLALFPSTLADIISRLRLYPGGVPGGRSTGAAGRLVSIGALYGPAIADGFYQLSRQLPPALDRLRGTLEQYAWGPAFLDTLSRAGGTLTNPQQLSRIAGIFSTAFGALGSLLIVIVLGIYYDAAAHLLTSLAFTPPLGILAFRPWLAPSASWRVLLAVWALGMAAGAVWEVIEWTLFPITRHHELLDLPHLDIVSNFPDALDTPGECRGTLFLCLAVGGPAKPHDGSVGIDVDIEGTNERVLHIGGFDFGSNRGVVDGHAGAGQKRAVRAPRNGDGSDGGKKNDGDGRYRRHEFAELDHCALLC
jgi:hypothetical protein